MAQRLLWVRAADSPWWPAQITDDALPFDSPQYDAVVRYFGGDSIGYVMLSDKSTVQPFQDNPHMMDAEADGDLRAAIKEAKAELKAAIKAQKRQPKRTLPGKRVVSDAELLTLKASLEGDVPRNDVLSVLRQLAEIDVDLNQLYRTKIGVAVSKYHHDDATQVATLATGILQYWFSCLEDDVRQRLLR